MDDFEKLCQQNKELVYRYLLALCHDAHLAEELTAETFYRAYLHIDRFRGECKAATWLCRIARNAYYKTCKKASRQESLENIAETAAAEHFLDKLCDREQAMEIYRALHALQEPYKEVFSLRVLGNLSFKEIAGIFAKTDTWARVTYYRTKEMLIPRMEANDED